MFPFSPVHFHINDSRVETSLSMMRRAGKTARLVRCKTTRPNTMQLRDAQPHWPLALTILPVCLHSGPSPDCYRIGQNWTASLASLISIIHSSSFNWLSFLAICCHSSASIQPLLAAHAQLKTNPKPNSDVTLSYYSNHHRIPTAIDRSKGDKICCPSY